MIGKSFLGESLAEVRSGLRRGGLVGIFIAEYAMKPPFFLKNFIFVLMHFRVFLKDKPYGVIIFSGLQGRVDAMRQPCLAKKLTPMGVFVGEIWRKLREVRRIIGIIIGVRLKMRVICV